MIRIERRRRHPALAFPRRAGRSRSSWPRSSSASCSPPPGITRCPPTARSTMRPFTSSGALSATFVYATPLLFTGLCAAVAFRMRVWNIGGEGQLYMGAVGASGAALALSGEPTVLADPRHDARRHGRRADLGGDPWCAACLPAHQRDPDLADAQLRRRPVHLLPHLRQQLVLARPHVSLAPACSRWASSCTTSAFWPGVAIGSFVLPLGFVIGVVVAALLWFLIRSTRFGFEMRVIGRFGAGRQLRGDAHQAPSC